MYVSVRSAAARICLHCQMKLSILLTFCAVKRTQRVCFSPVATTSSGRTFPSPDGVWTTVRQDVPRREGGTLVLRGSRPGPRQEPWPCEPATACGACSTDDSRALRKARSFSKDQDPDDHDSHGSPSLSPEILCVECKTVAQPCWYRVHCNELSFICDVYDAEDKASFSTHDLVRVQEVIDDVPLTIEQRLAELEARSS
ncbi:hypothetical protein K438DRAFT_1161505 [Mycena galopus ATCC 62051]|nr:hypothetical protein K438DRAFT_1161505 [Mycena galopus ATCC 62051]